MKKLRVMVDIEIDEESCIIAGIKEQELADNLTAYADDAVDGVVICQKATDRIVLGEPTIKKAEIVKIV